MKNDSPRIILLLFLFFLLSFTHSEGVNPADWASSLKLAKAPSRTQDVDAGIIMRVIPDVNEAVNKRQREQL